MNRCLPAFDLQAALAQTTGLVAVVRLVATHPVMVGVVVFIPVITIQ